MLESSLMCGWGDAFLLSNEKESSNSDSKRSDSKIRQVSS